MNFWNRGSCKFRMEVNQNSKAGNSWRWHYELKFTFGWKSFAPVTTLSGHDSFPTLGDSQARRHTMCCLYSLSQRSPWPSSPPCFAPREAVGGRAELSWAWSAGNVVFSLAATLFTERIPRHNEEMLEINQSHCQHRSKFNGFCPAAESSERFLVVSIYKHVVGELLHWKTKTVWVYVTRCRGEESKSVTVSSQTDLWI